jgi:hypothetical protein
MLDHDKISIIVGPGHVDRFLIRTGKDHSSVPGCIGRCSELVYKFDACMRVTLPIRRGGIAIGWIYKGVTGEMDGALKEEVAVEDAVVGG